MICQACGVEAPTRHVAFYQNIGALIMRFSRSIDGRLCKSCIHGNFWRMQLTTLFLGWWGVISLIVTPFFLLNNGFWYLLSLFMRGVPRGARSPMLTDEAMERITPFAPELFDRLTRREPFALVARVIAHRASVTPGQVTLFVKAFIEAQKAREGSAT